MLQQTQVERVLGKYRHFLSLFPDFATLSTASLRDVLQVWDGLGYNRRALNLVRAARIVTSDFGGILPAKYESLRKLPGVGSATANSILVFAFNIPRVFLETNIRRVFLHFFFQEQFDIHDNAILSLIEETLDRSNPREWYYALMDYGAMLRRSIENPNRRSVHYKKQSSFKGSEREIRGMILRTLLHTNSLPFQTLQEMIHKTPESVKKILTQLAREGFLKEDDEGVWSLCEDPLSRE